ncbi:site-specific integrase [Coraliomargarita sp. SDUM461003]|uniref:Site-specific integrase n=1 Tax=Thalassobacterium maritimum TaxID=3041265 RepID=A0ABU1ARF8_9BACT|nr:site-specific integrase [Coraliomargarita sp. SDUM461003]MDQ8206676.1 site-specific integrase [Coraliomargarita sp. SDUM461003]
MAELFERAARGELQREAEIKETFNELLVLGGSAPVESLTAKAFFASWIERAEKSGKPETTMQRYRQVSRDFVNSLGDRSEAPFEQITAGDAQSYIDGLAAKGLAKKTITNSLKILRIPFAEQCRLGKLSFNPAAAAKPSETARGSMEKAPFEPEQIGALLKACKSIELGNEWITAIHFAYYCAMRLADATRMTWEAIDFQKNTISFVPQKTRKKNPAPIELPLHPALQDHLLKLSLPDDPATCITPELHAWKPADRSRFFSYKLMPLAGIDQKRTGPALDKDSKDKGRGVSKLSFHSFRHSLASHLAAAGVAPELRMKITSHSDEKVHKGYSHLETETLRDGLSKLPSIEF